MSWVRVNKNKPCPICGKPDWCSVTVDGACRCMRVQEAPGWKAIKQHVDGGVTFRPANEDTNEYKERYRPKPPPVRLYDWRNIQDELYQASEAATRKQLAEELGVRVIALTALGVGWHEKKEAHTFPMYHEQGVVVGIRMRSRSGKKYALPGSKDGLFGIFDMSYKSTDPILVAEGPTDVAALLDLGFHFSVGRPSCRGAVGILKKLLKCRDVVIISDADGPGVDGAKSLAHSLIGIVNRLKIVVPPENDVREWRNKGATRDDVQLLISNTQECKDAGQIQSITSE